MSEEANLLVSWSSTTGTKKSVITVVDKSKDKSDVDRKRIELCKYDTDKEKWVTENVFDYIEEIEDFGIPEEFIN